MAKGVIALLGSGETAPGMTKVHREILAPLQPLRAVNLDTTYGFQENVPQMSKKLEDYFSTSLNVALETLHFPSFENASELDRARFKLRVKASNYVFAGPGSPTYALAQWSPLNLENDLIDVLDNGGTVCFASAAALTLGAFTAPIYEIYKVGAKLHWVNGLNVLGAIGLECAVIPHYDNNEGGNYDTRFCYLGERRLRLLEDLLPENAAVLGIDEHTALILDLATDTLTVRGRGNAYCRVQNTEKVLTKGKTIPLSELRAVTESHRPLRQEVSSAVSTNSLTDLADRVLAAGPTSQEALAQLIEMAANGGEGHVDPTSLIEGVLRVRRVAREQGHYDLADLLRQALIEAKVEVQDGPDGSTWSLH
jgi:hypothetical protein